MQTLLWCKDLKFCPDNSRNDWHDNVHDNVNVFGLGRIDLLHCCCGRASTETCYCNTSTTCCCEYVRNTAAAHITYINNPHSIHDYPIADLFRDGGGFLKHASTTIANIAKYLNAEQRAHCNSLRVHYITGFIFLYCDQKYTALMSISDS